MKTYINQIERRTIVRQLQTWGIIGYDLDNAYPQRMMELVGQSPTAKDCWDKRTKYIAGNGFQEADLGKKVINDHGLTLAKLLKSVATDKALFTGFAIHVNYNANFEITELHYVKFEDVRQGDPDNKNYSNKYALYFDWGRKTWKNITTSKIDYVYRYNPDPEVITDQVIDAGGWDKYNGQLYYFNPEIDDYPLICADSVWEDFETESGIKIFNNREVVTGFMPSTIITMPGARVEEEDNAEPSDGMTPINQPSQLDRNLSTFQGAKNAQKILVLEHSDDSDKPEITSFSIQNNDKLFEATEKSVEKRIIKGFSIPKELINAEKSSGLSNGGEKKEAIREFNDNTSPERLELSEMLAELFSHFHDQTINPANNWTILEVSGNVADDMVGKVSGANINQLLVMGIPRINKIAILVNAYNFKLEEAEAMVPEDKDITSTELAKTPKTTEE